MKSSSEMGYFQRINQSYENDPKAKHIALRKALTDFCTLNGIIPKSTNDDIQVKITPITTPKSVSSTASTSSSSVSGTSPLETVIIINDAVSELQSAAQTASQFDTSNNSSIKSSVHPDPDFIKMPPCIVSLVISSKPVPSLKINKININGEHRTIDILKKLNANQINQLFKAAGDSAKGDKIAQLEIGLCHLFGYVNLPQDNKIGLQYIHLSADNGYHYAATLLGKYYRSGQFGLNIDNVKSFEYSLAAANAGNAEAQFLLFIRYKFGRGVLTDNAKALYWLQESINNNYHEGLYILGSNILRNKDLTQHHKQANLLLVKASLGWNVRSFEYIGKILKNKNYLISSFNCLLYAAKQNHESSMLLIADLLKSNVQFGPDLAGAKYWLEEAAKKGNTTANFTVNLYKEAAELGSDIARKKIAEYEGNAKLEFENNRMAKCKEQINQIEQTELQLKQLQSELANWITSQKDTEEEIQKEGSEKSRELEKLGELEKSKKSKDSPSAKRQKTMSTDKDNAKANVLTQFKL